MAKEGTGVSIGFGSSNWTAEFTKIGGLELSREALDTTHLGTTSYKTKVPASLVEAGELEVEFWFDPGDSPPISSAAETITITYPDTETWSFSGFMTNFKAGSAVDGELMSGSATLVAAGAPTISSSSSSA